MQWPGAAPLLTFAFTVRWQADRRAYLVQDSYGTVLGVCTDKNDAVQCALREAMLAMHAGLRVIVMLQGDSGEFDHVATADPLALDVRPALLS